MKKITDIKKHLLSFDGGDKAFEFLQTADDTTAKGRHDFSDRLYVNLVSYETKKGFDGVFESHRDYIDLHVILYGEERAYFGDKSDMVVTKKYDEQGDYELLKGGEYSYIDYFEMQGVEFSVNEPHMAGRCVSAPQKVLKAIGKIKI